MIANFVMAADYLWPLPDSHILTGGFADSRPEHFHGGVDLRARSPLRVVAPTDGWVERVGINPPGYGRTLYFRLSDGNTAVFGHLSRYEPELQEIVRDSQLVCGTYRVDFSFTDSATAPRYKAGETLCFSGSSGRGPAHLHFEIRNGALQLDPLQFYSPADRDKPVIVGVNWIKYSDNIPSSSGQSLALNVSPRVNSDEPVAFLIRTYDPGPWGRNAVPRASRVYQGEQLIFEDRSAEIDLEGPQVIYEKLVYREFKHNDRDVRRLFKWFPLDLGVDARLPQGWIENFNGGVRIEVEDRNGNTTSQTIDVNIGDKLRQPFVGALKAATTFQLTGDQVAFSWANFTERNSECLINDEDFAFPAKLVLKSDEKFEPGKYWYKRGGAAGRSPMWRIPADDPELMSCYVLRGGTYGISVDATPPKLTLSGASGKLTFKLSDNESSIDDSSVRCRVDGETAIPEFEYEEDGGTIWTQTALSRGQHRVEFEAMNRAGLLKTWDVMVTIP